MKTFITLLLNKKNTLLIRHKPIYEIDKRFMHTNTHVNALFILKISKTRLCMLNRYFITNRGMKKTTEVATKIAQGMAKEGTDAAGVAAGANAGVAPGARGSNIHVAATQKPKLYPEPEPVKVPIKPPVFDNTSLADKIKKDNPDKFPSGITTSTTAPANTSENPLDPEASVNHVNPPDFVPPSTPKFVKPYENPKTQKSSPNIPKITDAITGKERPMTFDEERKKKTQDRANRQHEIEEKIKKLDKERDDKDEFDRNKDYREEAAEKEKPIFKRTLIVQHSSGNDEQHDIVDSNHNKGKVSYEMVKILDEKGNIINQYARVLIPEHLTPENIKKSSPGYFMDKKPQIQDPITGQIRDKTFDEHLRDVLKERRDFVENPTIPPEVSSKEFIRQQYLTSEKRMANYSFMNELMKKEEQRNTLLMYELYGINEGLNHIFENIILNKDPNVPFSEDEKQTLQKLQSIFNIYIKPLGKDFYAGEDEYFKEYLRILPSLIELKKNHKEHTDLINQFEEYLFTPKFSNIMTPKEIEKDLIHKEKGRLLLTQIKENPHLREMLGEDIFFSLLRRMDLVSTKRAISDPIIDLNVKAFQIIHNNPDLFYVKDKVNLSDLQKKTLVYQIGAGIFKIYRIKNDPDNPKSLKAGEELHDNLIIAIPHVDKPNVLEYVSTGFFTSSSPNPKDPLDNLLQLAPHQVKYINGTQQIVPKPQGFRIETHVVRVNKASLEESFDLNMLLESDPILKENLIKGILNYKETFTNNPIREIVVLDKEALLDLMLKANEAETKERQKDFDRSIKKFKQWKNPKEHEEQEKKQRKNVEKNMQSSQEAKFRKILPEELQKIQDYIVELKKKEIKQLEEDKKNLEKAQKEKYITQ